MHILVMCTSQCVWLDQIKDRFTGVETPSGCRQSRVEKRLSGKKTNTEGEYISYGKKTTRGEDYTESGIHKEETIRERNYARGNYTRRGHTEKEREKKKKIGKKRKEKEKKKEREKKERRRKKGNNI